MAQDVITPKPDLCGVKLVACWTGRQIWDMSLHTPISDMALAQQHRTDHRSLRSVHHVCSSLLQIVTRRQTCIGSCKSAGFKAPMLLA